jgi:hypothetical protein
MIATKQQQLTISPTLVKVNCRLKYFVTLVTYCYINVFVYFNHQLALTGVGETGPTSRLMTQTFSKKVFQLTFFVIIFRLKSRYNKK